MFPATALLFLGLVPAVISCTGNSSAFSWELINNHLTQCSIANLNVSAGLRVPTLPMTVTVFPVSGVAVSHTFPSSAGPWGWIVPLSAGTRAYLAMTDGKGFHGGTSPLLTISASNVTTCLSLVVSPVAPVQISLNSTNLTSNCSSLSVKLTGGFPPYHVLIVQPSSAILINTTLGADETGVVFQGASNLTGPFLVSAADAFGSTATSPLVYTDAEALPNTVCSPLLDSSTTSHPTTTLTINPSAILQPAVAPTQSAPAPASPSAVPSEEPTSGKSVAATTVVAIFGTLGALAATGFCFWGLTQAIRRRDRRSREKASLRPFVFSPTSATIAATPGRMGEAEKGPSHRSSPFSPKILFSRAIRSPTSGPASPAQSPGTPTQRTYQPIVVEEATEREPLAPPNSMVSDLETSPVGNNPLSNLSPLRRRPTPSGFVTVTPVRQRLMESKPRTPNSGGSTSAFSPSSLLARLTPTRLRSRASPSPLNLTDVPPLRIRRGRTVVTDRANAERMAEKENLVPPCPRYDSPLPSPASSVQMSSYLAHAEGYSNAFRQLGTPRTAPRPPLYSRVSSPNLDSPTVDTSPYRQKELKAEKIDRFSLANDVPEGPEGYDPEEDHSLLTAQEIEWALAM